MNQNQFNNGNNFIDQNQVNNMLIQNQYLLMNQMNMFNNMNNQFFQNMNGVPNCNNNLNNNFNNNFNINNNIPDSIDIKFKDENNQIMTIRARLDDKLSNIISKYKVFISDNSNNKEYLFLNKKICLDLTAAEQGLTNNCEIEVRKRNINEEKKNEENKKENKKDEKELVKKCKEGIFNGLKSGINILGKCTNKGCQFKDQEVISFYKDKKFEFVSNLYNVFCPNCSCIIIPKKIAFYQCSFIISGKKLSGEFVVPFSNNEIIKFKNNNYYYIFDPEFDNNTIYIELLCQILKNYYLNSRFINLHAH